MWLLASIQKPLIGSRLRALAGLGYARVTDATPFGSGSTLFATHFPEAPSGTFVYLRGGLV